VNLATSVAVSDSIRDIKANASRWVNGRPDRGMPFEWQKGYGAFTVSYSQLDVVRRYIQTQ
jgi:putative transposase